MRCRPVHELTIFLVEENTSIHTRQEEVDRAIPIEVAGDIPPGTRNDCRNDLCIIELEHTRAVIEEQNVPRRTVVVADCCDVV